MEVSRSLHAMKNQSFFLLANDALVKMKQVELDEKGKTKSTRSNFIMNLRSTSTWTWSWSFWTSGSSLSVCSNIVPPAFINIKTITIMILSMSFGNGKQKKQINFCKWLIPVIMLSTFKLMLMGKLNFEIAVFLLWYSEQENRRSAETDVKIGVLI